jgi:hypothetical protein
MTVTLEELLKEACAKGLTHLTLYPVPAADGRITYWHARATPSTGHHYVARAGTDPIDVLSEVLSNLPKAPKRAVTAAVKRPPLATEPTTIPAKLDPELEDWLPKS